MSGVTFTGYQNFQRRLRQIQDPPAAAKDDAGKEAVKGLEGNFQGNPLGLRALKPDTIRRKGHGRILFDRGDLASAFGYQLTPSGLQAFNDDVKAMIHIRSNRNFMQLRPEVLQEMLKALVAGMLK